MHWIYLLLGIVCEVFATMSLKMSAQQGGKIWMVALAVGYVASFSLVWMATKVIDIGTVYAIWAGMGTALIAVLGWLIFKEEMSLAKAGFIVMIVVGVAGLKFVSEGAEAV